MHKISNFTGQARHGWERMTPAFGMSRPHPDMHAASQSMRRPHVAPALTTHSTADPTVNLSFNVPFASCLAGPDVEDILHASPGALQRWTFPEGTPEGTPIHNLPVHVSHVEALRGLCRTAAETNRRLEATVTTSEPKTLPSMQRRQQTLVTNVCLSGDGDIVRQTRARILNETPISLVSLVHFPQPELLIVS